MAMTDSLNMFRLAEKLSIPQLIQALKNGTIDSSVGQLVLNNKVKQQKQMQNAAATNQPKRPPIAQENMAMGEQMSGVANAPMAQDIYSGQGFSSGGGIMAFAKGGPTEEFPLDPETRNRLLEYANGNGFPLDKATAERLKKYGVDPGSKAQVRQFLDTSTRPNMFSTNPKMYDTPNPVTAGLDAITSSPPPKDPTAKKATEKSGGVEKWKGVPSGLNPLTEIGKGAQIVRDIPSRLSELFGGNNTPGITPRAPDAGAAGAMAAMQAAQAGQQTPPPGTGAPPGFGGTAPGAPAMLGYGGVLAKLNEDPEAQIAAASKKREAEYGANDKEAFDSIRGMIDKQKGGLDKVDKQNMWLSIMKGGLAAAGGNSQYAAQNIAQGAEEGVNSYVQRDVLNTAMKNQVAQAEQMMKLQELANAKGNRQMADQYGQGIQQAKQNIAQIQGQLIGQQNQNTLGMAQLGVQKYGIDMQAATAGRMYDAAMLRAKAMGAGALVRAKQIEQKARSEFLQGPGRRLNAELSKQYGSNWGKPVAEGGNVEGHRQFEGAMKAYTGSSIQQELEGMYGSGIGGMGGGMPIDEQRIPYGPDM